MQTATFKISDKITTEHLLDVINAHGYGDYVDIIREVPEYERETKGVREVVISYKAHSTNQKELDSFLYDFVSKLSKILNLPYFIDSGKNQISVACNALVVVVHSYKAKGEKKVIRKLRKFNDVRLYNKQIDRLAANSVFKAGRQDISVFKKNARILKRFQNLTEEDKEKDKWKTPPKYKKVQQISIPYKRGSEDEYFTPYEVDYFRKSIDKYIADQNDGRADTGEDIGTPWRKDGPGGGILTSMTISKYADEQGVLKGKFPNAKRIKQEYVNKLADSYTVENKVFNSLIGEPDRANITAKVNKNIFSDDIYSIKCAKTISKNLKALPGESEISITVDKKIGQDHKYYYTSKIFKKTIFLAPKKWLSGRFSPHDQQGLTVGKKSDSGRGALWAPAARTAMQAQRAAKAGNMDAQDAFSLPPQHSDFGARLNVNMGSKVTILNVQQQYSSKKIGLPIGARLKGSSGAVCPITAFEIFEGIHNRYIVGLDLTVRLSAAFNFGSNDAKTGAAFKSSKYGVKIGSYMHVDKVLKTSIENARLTEYRNLLLSRRQNQQNQQNQYNQQDEQEAYKAIGNQLVEQGCEQALEQIASGLTDKLAKSFDGLTAADIKNKSFEETYLVYRARQLKNNPSPANQKALGYAYKKASSTKEGSDMIRDAMGKLANDYNSAYRDGYGGFQISEAADKLVRDWQHMDTLSPEPGDWKKRFKKGFLEYADFISGRHVEEKNPAGFSFFNPKEASVPVSKGFGKIFQGGSDWGFVYSPYSAPATKTAIAKLIENRRENDGSHFWSGFW